MMLPSRIPDGTLKKTLSGIQLPSVHLQGSEGFDEVNDEGISSLRLNYHIIDVSLNVLPDLVLKATLDGSLISSTRILEPKGHGRVVVGTEGMMNEILIWSSSFGAIW
jgi:hypothetical protein